MKDFELSDQEINLLCSALDKYPVVMARDKSWWLPLTKQLPEPKDVKEATVVNGHPN